MTFQGSIRSIPIRNGESQILTGLCWFCCAFRVLLNALILAPPSANDPHVFWLKDSIWCQNRSHDTSHSNHPKGLCSSPDPKIHPKAGFSAEFPAIPDVPSIFPSYVYHHFFHPFPRFQVPGVSRFPGFAAWQQHLPRDRLLLHHLHQLLWRQEDLAEPLADLRFLPLLRRSHGSHGDGEGHMGMVRPRVNDRDLINGRSSGS